MLEAHIHEQHSATHDAAPVAARQSPKASKHGLKLVEFLVKTVLHHFTNAVKISSQDTFYRNKLGHIKILSACFTAFI
ncbi:hypothetical protein SFRURICE_017237 [Spodoptera frugiperda]|nr:hypothetical protein SFRURICE_017237 [Spodoptera frugiperda]